MTKNDLADEMVSNTTLTKVQALEAIEGLMQSLAKAFQYGENIYLRGLGTFRIEERASKKARNIRRGTTITVPAHRTVKFLLCKELKERINNNH